MFPVNVEHFLGWDGLLVFCGGGGPLICSPVVATGV